MLGFFIQYRFGNVKYSQHVYGGAADIFIDENPKDEMMDDFFSILQIRTSFQLKFEIPAVFGFRSSQNLFDKAVLIGLGVAGADSNDTIKAFIAV